MALAGLLSALRQLVLNADVAIPDDEDSRRTLYAGLFSGLRDDELCDLAKISPTQLQIYVRSANLERQGMLRARFPITLYLLQRYWKTDFSLARLVHSLHSFSPWRTQFSLDLAECFVRFIREGPDQLALKSPALSEVAALEFLSVKIRQAANAQSLQKIVDERTDTGIFFSVPEYVEFRCFEYNVVDVWLRFHTGNQPPDPILQRLTWAVGTRNQRGFSRWFELPGYLFAILETLPRGRILSSAGLMSALLSNDSEGRGWVASEEAVESCLGQLAQVGMLALHS